MIVRTLSDIKAALATFDFDERFDIDTETTSFDDAVEAFNPYLGHRATLIMIKQRRKDVVTIPLRHRVEVSACVEDFEGTVEYLREWALNVKRISNLNFKFDMHVLWQDSIDFKNAVIEDTGVLARLVYNEHMSYSLDNLCKTYDVHQKDASAVKAWLEQHNTKDYGKIPMSILVPYGENDVVANEALHDRLLAELPGESLPAWNIEKRVTRILFESERDGIQVDVKFLQLEKIRHIKRMLILAKDIQELAGINNPSSSAQIGTYFESLGIHSNKMTKPTPENPKGNPSWDKDVLDWIASLGTDVPNKVAAMLMEFGKEELAESTFCTGWLKHVDSNGRIHGNNKQAGTVSGRSSSEKPNTQNCPKWLFEGILIPPGYCGIAWDLSQIEYRLFAHYANDPAIILKYAENPKVDFHQILADKLGIPRNPVKRINFGILYGMGKKKTTTTIRREILAYELDPNIPDDKKTVLREHLYGAYYDPTEPVPPVTQAIPLDVLTTIAENILIEYHQLNPQIKAMQRTIKQLLAQRGYIKSYFGRRAHLGVDRAYVGLNRAIQGSAADLFKKKMAELFEATKVQQIDARMQQQVHDAIYAVVKIEDVQRYVNLAYKIVTDNAFRVPVLMDFELALYRWSNKIKISHDSDVLLELGKIAMYKHSYRKG